MPADFAPALHAFLFLTGGSDFIHGKAVVCLCKHGADDFTKRRFVAPVVMTPVVMTPVVMTPVVMTPVVMTPVVMTVSACRWLHVLPREVKEAAGPGCACCLFWPPADAAGRRPTETSQGLWQLARRLPLVQYVSLAAKVSPVLLHLLLLLAFSSFLLTPLLNPLS